MSEPPARSFTVDPHEYPFASHWLEKGGVRMHYVDEGTGIPVLLLHGNPTWSYLYRNIIKALSAEARLVAPDYPGFGFSEHPPGYGYTPAEHAQWINALIDHARLKNMILVGQDWGGSIGLSIAVQRPSDFSGLVLLNTWCWPPTFDARLFSWIMGSRVLGRYLNIKRNFFAREIIPFGIYHKERLSPTLLRAYTDPFPTEASRIGTWMFPGEIRRSARWLADIESKLGLLQDKPVVMVWAMKDVAFGKQWVIRRWLRVFPKAELEKLDDASHYLQEDRPDRVVAGIRKVIDRVRKRMT